MFERFSIRNLSVLDTAQTNGFDAGNVLKDIRTFNKMMTIASGTVFKSKGPERPSAMHCFDIL